MPNNPESPSDREQRLEKVLADYLHAVDAGQAPNRDEMLTLHPDLAADLASFFRNRDAMERLAEPIKEQAVLPETIGSPGDGPGVGTRVRYIGDYELLEEIARGGMGVVYKARQVSLKRLVALKMILAGEYAGPEELARFRTEGEAVARLQHPNIVQIYEVGSHEGHPYFSLEYCGGGSLAQRLGGTPLPPKQAAQIAETLARAMHVAHQAGIIHRDLKPANVLLSVAGGQWPVVSEDKSQQVSSLTTDHWPRNTVLKITDFGLAKKQSGPEAGETPSAYLSAAGLTVSGAIVGTPSYMAPEQAAGKGKEVTHAADVYALGAILYEMLTGRPPFRAAAPLETMMMVVANDPVPPGQLNSRTPRDLETICLKCLHKEPHKRYASAADLADDLARFQRGEPITARPVSTAERTWRWCRRNPVVAGLAATVLVTLVALLAVGLVYDAQLQRTLQEVEAQQAAVTQVQAEAEAQKAAVVRVRAEAEALLAEAGRHRDHTLYMRDMDTAQRELLAVYPERCEDLLDRHHMYDRRGWEWDYLKRQCHRELLTMPGAVCVAWSPDGKLLATATPAARYPGEKYDPNAWADIQLRDAATGQLVRTLHEGTTSITCLAYSADGSRLVILRVSDMLEVWEVATGRLLRSWQDEGRPVGARVAFRGDGKQVATRCGEEVRVWDAETGKLERKLYYRPEYERTNNSVECFAYSPDGKLLAVGTSYGHAVLWEAATGKQVRILKGHGSAVMAVGFSPDGKLLLTGGFKDGARLWNVESGASLRAVAAHEGAVYNVAFSPDGSRAATAGRDRIRIWQTDQWRQLAAWPVLNQTIVVPLAFSPDSQRLATVNYSGSPVRIWDARDPAEAWPAAFTTIGLSDLAVSPDGKMVALARVSNTAKEDKDGHWMESEVEVCDLATGRVLQVVERNRLRSEQFKPWTKRVAFSPDGKRLAVVDARERFHVGEVLPPPATVRVFDLAQGRQVLTLEQAGERVAFSPDGRWIATRSNPRPEEEALVGAVRLWDAQTGKQGAAFRLTEGAAGGLAFSPDARFLALAGKPIVLLEVTPSGLRLAQTIDREGRSLAFSPDGRLLAASAWPGHVDLWDVGTGRLVRDIHQERHSGHGPEGSYALLAYSPLNLAFSPDGRRLAYATDDRTVRLHDVEGGQDLLLLDDFRVQVSRLFFSRDGRRLFAVDSMPRWHIWDATPLPDETAFARLALARLTALAKEMLPRSELIQRVRADQTLSEAARAVTLKLAETAVGDANRFNNAAWDVALLPDKGAAAYERALQHAVAACELEPDNFNHENTRAAVLYRLGRYKEALAILRRCVALRKDKGRELEYGDHAFLAMTCHRLGLASEARGHLKALQQTKEEGDADFLRLRREAEMLIDGKQRPGS